MTIREAPRHAFDCRQASGTSRCRSLLGCARRSDRGDDGAVPGASGFKAHSGRRLPSATHGTLREVNGFSLVQLTAEFRALRASVLRLWLPSISEFNQEVHEELVRFNEAVDQALAESAATFSEHNNQTRERFLAILGHDLRTPLAAVSMTGSLLERSRSVEGNAEIGKRLLRSAAPMSTMVNDLLEYSRTQLGGKMPMAPAPANMGDIVKAALNDAASANPDCIFELDLRGELWGVFDDVRCSRSSSICSPMLLNTGRRGRTSSSTSQGNSTTLYSR